MDGYNTLRTKVEVYAARARSKESEEVAGLELMQGLRGRAWEAAEDIDIPDVEEEKGWMMILGALDRSHRYDQVTELPADFENF